MSEVPLLRAQGIGKVFKVPERSGLLPRTRDFQALQDVSFKVHHGETVALVGESGSGKSTTARIAARLIDPTSGRLEFEGKDVTQSRGRELTTLRSSVQFVFQDPYSSLNPRHTVEQIITAPLVYQGRAVPGGSRQFAGTLLEQVGLKPEYVDRYPHQFSGGQAQRIGIARAIALRPALVICDEAVSALDVSVQAQIIELLRDLQRSYGFSYLFIAHDLAVVRQLAHWVCVMNQGRIVEQGGRDQIFTDPQHPYTRELLAAIPRIPAEWSSPDT
ncbi:ATP-binding cassette domain-containing protein [Ornithinimicrobium avium]|uniref:ABC transporter ATP-binding protein n=1 Tax=Ornithinimicrobium avium TaxID=2283195 RepID=A0A345NMW8_9MICO|nr:ATP-binding cassette domain-containing protein [Ornithinimicrobium avium]AXH96376.1 ABC transporter ATP-binding protein [Ornithinimicrobium avium]